MFGKPPVVLTFCVIFLCVSENSGAKILGVFPFFAPSHYFLGNELMKGLAEAGHDVTIMTVFEEKNPPKNGKYRQIVMENLIKKQQDLLGHLLNLNSSAVQNFFSNPLAMIPKFFSMGIAVAEMSLSHPKMQKMIKSKEKFDVVIIPQFTVEGLKALAPHLGAHLVIFNNNGPNSWMNHFVGNPMLSSFNSEVILGYTGQMNFQQRLINTLFKMIQYSANCLMIYPSHNDLVHKYVSKDLDLTEIQYNVSLVLSNAHTSLMKAQSSVPCMKEIAGFHVKPPKKLPEDLKKFLDNAKDGVIYFSMGSNLKGADIPIETRAALMKAFSKRKEKILWKFESDEMPGKPDNVRIEKWLPQSDVLAHPNVKLFITHGGFLSTIETVYHGVPIIAVPIFGDQLMNAKMAQNEGYAIMLDFKSLTEESVSSAIEEILSDKKYLKNVQYRSTVFHDRQVTPMDEAVYWIEYIVKHNGAKHLRVDYLNLTWYQYYLLDVFAVIFAVFFLLFVVVKKTVRAILGLCVKKPEKSKAKKVKKH